VVHAPTLPFACVAGGPESAIAAGDELLEHAGTDAPNISAPSAHDEIKNVFAFKVRVL
jgi:hypothetical protein